MFKMNTVKSEKSHTQKCFIPEEKEMLCLFSFGIKHFWGAAFISDFTVYKFFSIHFHVSYFPQFQINLSETLYVLLVCRYL